MWQMPQRIGLLFSSVNPCRSKSRPRAARQTGARSASGLPSAATRFRRPMYRSGATFLAGPRLVLRQRKNRSGRRDEPDFADQNDSLPCLSGDFSPGRVRVGPSHRSNLSDLRLEAHRRGDCTCPLVGPCRDSHGKSRLKSSVEPATRCRGDWRRCRRGGTAFCWFGLGSRPSRLLPQNSGEALGRLDCCMPADCSHSNR